MFTGADSRTLRVNISSAAQLSDVLGDYVCQAWYSDDDPAVFSLSSRAARIVLQTLPDHTAAADTIRVVAGETATFATNYSSEVAVVRYEYLFTNETGAQEVVQFGDGFPSALVIEEATSSHAGDYVLRLYGQCNTVDVA